MAARDLSTPSLPATQLSIERIRKGMHAALCDCKDIRAQRVIFKINVAKTPADLWLLRSDLLRCIAHVHGQQVGVERINDLIRIFKGWLSVSESAYANPYVPRETS